MKIDLDQKLTRAFGANPAYPPMAIHEDGFTTKDILNLHLACSLNVWTWTVRSTMEVNMRAAFVLGVAALAVSAGAASAQVVYPGYGYAPYGYGYAGYGYGATAPLYDYAAPVADLAPPAYGYAPAAPLYNYAAPAYAAPATAGTTVVIVTPAPAYSAPVVGSGLYNYAPGYWGGGYGRAGYWGGYGYGWR